MQTKSTVNLNKHVPDMNNLYMPITTDDYYGED